jgi:23S rRNA G2445 N2-methylase RlmL
MYTLLPITEYFLEESVTKDLDALSISYIQGKNGLVEIPCNSEKECVLTALKIIQYARTINHLYLKVASGKQLSSLTFETISLKDSLVYSCYDEDFKESELKTIAKQWEQHFTIPLEIKKHEDKEISVVVFDEEEDGYIVAIDVVGFPLSKRKYKIRSYEDELSPLIVAFCVDKLSLLDKTDKHYSFLDPNTQLGDILIELSLFFPRYPLFQKEKQILSLGKLFQLPLQIQPPPKQISKFVGFVQNSNEFAYCKENNSYHQRKIQLSTADLDWLDVKFHKGDFDYIITQFPYFENEEEKNEYEEHFFYQAEFVTKEKIVVITENHINETYIKKYQLTIEDLEEIECMGEQYLLYSIGHDKKRKNT